MANIKISQLTALTPPDATDLVPVTDSSASQTKRTTVGEIVGIVNGDVDVADDGTATISELPVSKLQDGDARQLLQTDAAGTGVEWTSNIDIPGTLDVTSTATFDAALNVAGLASLDGGIDVDGVFTVGNATGNIVTTGTLGVSGQSTLASAAVSDLTSGRVVLAGTSGELEDSAGLTFNGTQLDVDGNVVITGDLTVEGASTILETETVKVEDKNIELGVVASPTDVTADGGGITLKGTTNKTINWVDATDSWTSSEHIDLASGKSYRINDTEVLNSTTLGSGVTGSSLTSVGILSSLAVSGNVGIGLETPGANLHVQGAAGSSCSVYLTDGDATGTGNSLFINKSGTITTIRDRQAGSTLVLGTADQERLRIKSTGYVGVNTSDPTQFLQVNGAIVATGAAATYSVDGIYLQNKGSSLFDVSAWRSGANASILTFSTDSGSDATPVERLRITNTGAVQIADAGNIVVGTSTGTKVGTATTQKLGFYNATPVVQPAAVADATDAASAITQLNALLSRMRDLGLIAT